MKLEKGWIYKSDCIKQMNLLIKDKTQVDAIITDPPYNISRKNNFHTLSGRKGIDFGEWDKSFEQLRWLNSANHLLKKGGNIIIFNDWKNLGVIARYLNQQFGYEIKDVIRWVKNNPMPRNRDRRYITDYEFAIWLVKPGAKWTFNRINKNYQRPEFKHSIVSGREKTQHPTQKSLDLFKDLIKIHSNVGDLILDPFMGSGTTCLAAQELNRYFIGIENKKKYHDIAEHRLNPYKLVKSPLNYLGGKYKYLEQITKHFPPENKITNFYDVFFGSGEVSFNSQYKKIIAFEKIGPLVNLHKHLMKYTFKTIDKKISKIIEKYNLTQSWKTPAIKTANQGYKYLNEVGYQLLKDDYNKNNDPLLFLVLIFYGFNSQIRFNSSGDYNIPIGKSDYNNTKRNNLKNFMDKMKNHKKSLILSNKDFFDFDLSKIQKNDFLYFDPPYLITNSTYNESNKWSEKEEVKLYEILKSLDSNGIKWCLSNVISKGNKTNHILEKFIKHNKHFKQITIQTKYKNYQRKTSQTKEILLKNY